MKNKKENIKNSNKKQGKKGKAKSNDSISQIFSLLKQLNMLAIAIDRNKKIAFANDSFCNIAGYQIDELIGKNLTKLLIPSENVKAENEHLAEIKKNIKFISNFQNSIKAKDNSLKFIVWNDLLFKDFITKSSYIIRIGIDITEIKKTEEKKYELLDIIKRGKEEWEVTADSLPELISLTDLDGNIIRINKAIESWNLCPVKQAINKHIHTALHNQCEADCYLIDLLNQALKNAEEGKWVEHQSFDKKLSKHLFFRIRPLFKWAPDKKIDSLVIIISDITEKIKAEETSQRRQKAFQLVYDIAISANPNLEDICNSVAQSVVSLLEVNYFDIGILEGDHLYIITRITSGKLYNTEKLPIDGTPCEYVLEKREKCQLKGDLKQFFPKFPPLSEHSFRTYIGLPIKMSNSKLIGTISIMDFRERFFDENEIQLLEIFASYLAREIKRQEMEKKLQETQQMHLFGQLAAGIAHEVRNPLNTIIALTEAITMDAAKNSEYHPFIKQMLIQVNRLSKLMNDLLNFGKVAQKLDLCLTSLPTLCKEVAENWKKSNPNDQHQIKIIIKAPIKNIETKVDSYKLQQAIYNLIDNAAQNSAPSTNIIIEMMKPATDLIKLRIIDQGIGIKPELISKVFDPFFTTRKSGVGLGLTVVKQIIELHNGKIFLSNNTPQPGCTAEIILPAT